MVEQNFSVSVYVSNYLTTLMPQSRNSTLRDTAKWCRDQVEQ